MIILYKERYSVAMNETIFDGKGKIYAQFRPSYPKAFLDYLYSDVGMNKGSIIADIGSGTGILTQKLLDNVYKVFAVEPNLDMQKVAEAKLKNICGFISVNGTAENTTLLEQSVDYITTAQAFHWFDRQAFRRECTRILKPNGKVILIWNCRDENSKLVQETNKISQRHCPNFKGIASGMRGARSKDDFNDFFDGKYDIKSFQNDLTFDEKSFIGLHQSASYAPKESEINYLPYIAELRELFDQCNKDGKLIMPNLTRSYTGNV